MLNRKFIIGILVLLVCAPIVSWIIWNSQTIRPIGFTIFDKRVPQKQAIFHQALNWILNYNKFYKPDNTPFLPERSVKEYAPVKNIAFSINSVKTTKSELYKKTKYIDFAYFTELPCEAPSKTPFPTKQADYLHPFNTFTGNDYTMLTLLKNEQKPIITEGNFITHFINYKIQGLYQKQFGIRWTGWCGKFFFSLDTSINKEIPKWITKAYMLQYKKRWNYKRSGIVMVDTNNRIFVLEKGKQLEREVPMIQSSKYAIQKYNLPDEIHYPTWFYIMQTGEQNNVVARFRLYTNKNGDSILRQYSIPKAFPAIIEHTGDYTYYHFAADFSNFPSHFSFSKLKYIDFLSPLFYKRNYSEKDMFFWEYYIPLMTSIFNKTIIHNKK